jgi:hypothetical protein
MFAALLLALSAPAEPIAKLKPTDYVNDFAHVLDQNAIAQIDEICREIDQKAHAQIAVVTIHSTDGADIESYAVDLFHQWGVGSKSTDRGVLILYAIDDHRARIEVGYGLEPILPDGKVGGFQREAIPLMRAGNYSAVASYFTRCDDHRTGCRGPTYYSSTRGASKPARRAARRRNVSRRSSFADCCRFDRFVHAPSRHTFRHADWEHTGWWRIPRRWW